AELAFTYQMEKHDERVKKLAQDFNSNIVLPCDVSSDEQIDNLFPLLKKHWDKLDVIVHSLAFVTKEALKGDFVEATTRENFRVAHDISSYSFTALAKAALPMLSEHASLLTLSYLGAERTMPNYNVMGLAKASLEANVRYMSQSLGPKGIRVDFNEKHAALRRNVTIEEVGNAAAFLCSDLASGITGEITYVDGGMNITAAGSID
ncbi:MAG: enoyl-[acyl-carrier-protein] reductase, NADH-dependent, partial [Pseudomonadota bacterium]